MWPSGMLLVGFLMYVYVQTMELFAPGLIISISVCPFNIL